MYIWIFYSGCCLYAQPQQIIFNHYGPEEGLTTRTTRSVAKTSDGLLWLTTDDGLVRYDSERFYFFRHQPNNPQSLASDACDQMVVDDHDHIWVVAGKGLDKFDPATAQFVHTFIQQDTARIYAFYPEALAYDPARKRIWVGTSYGIYYVNEDSDALTKAAVDSASVDIAGATFFAITIDPTGNVWLGNSAGLYKFEPESGMIINQSSAGVEPGCSITDVMHIYADERDVLWIGTWNRGLIRFDQGTGECERFFYSDTSKMGNGVTWINASGFAGQEDVLWISAVNFGFVAFNKRTKTFTSYHTDLHRDKKGIPGVCNRMLTTATEGMWIASENGLHRYDPADQVFSQVDLIRHNPVFDAAYPVEFITFERSNDGKDSLSWFHVPYLGAFRYDLEKDKLNPAPEQLAKLFNDDIFGMFINHDNVLWISHLQSGLTGYDLIHQKIFFKAQKEEQTAFGRIHVFFEDRRHRLWLGTSNGLFFFDPLKGGVHGVDLVNSVLKENALSLSVNGIGEDEDGNIWFVTSEGRGHNHAAGRYNPMSGEMDLLYLGKPGMDKFPDETTFYDVVCGPGSVFVATDHGIMEISTSKDVSEVRMLSLTDGLINDLITSLALEKDSLLWCSTVFGVSAYHLKRKYFINYTYMSSGLGNGKHPNLYVSANTGEVYIGQQGGINKVRASQDLYPAVLPAILFSSVKVAGQEFFPEGTSILHTARLNLKHNQNPLTIEFAIPGFRHATANRYAYRLLGLEETWTYTDIAYVSFANLSPGQYTLQVKGANSAGIWNEPAELLLKILPPFYLSWWFRLSMVLIILGIAWYMVRLRFQALRDQFALRHKIAADLHDEIGSTLTSIHILSSVSQKALPHSPEQVMEMLSQITKQSKDIQQNMSDIVWAIRPDNDRIENLVIRLREYAAQTLEPLNIRTSIFLDEQLITRNLSINERKEVLLIAKEAINNAVKHAGATDVSISLQQKGNVIQLVIRDNGTWKGDANSTGTGRLSMQHRAGLLGGKLDYSFPEKGTVLTLEWPIT